ncbi:octapeptide-repeat protein T2-like [Arachis ipaensis]|uniref:octapeptide-repeat protein T2-like n=1 Tax=Arachis ipaensis TaxID=130454 RepID=UPI0007AF479D|nr:octapeptide-repeat protein T2-like [Arachis ipaensis]
MKPGSRAEYNGTRERGKMEEHCSEMVAAMNSRRWVVVIRGNREETKQGRSEKEKVRKGGRAREEERGGVWSRDARRRQWRLRQQRQRSRENEGGREKEKERELGTRREGNAVVNGGKMWSPDWRVLGVEGLEGWGWTEKKRERRWGGGEGVRDCARAFASLGVSKF